VQKKKIVGPGRIELLPLIVLDPTGWGQNENL
jgi:hypothetical protein